MSGGTCNGGAGEGVVNGCCNKTGCTVSWEIDRLWKSTLNNWISEFDWLNRVNYKLNYRFKLFYVFVVFLLSACPVVKLDAAEVETSVNDLPNYRFAHRTTMGQCGEVWQPLSNVADLSSYRRRPFDPEWTPAQQHESQTVSYPLTAVFEPQIRCLDGVNRVGFSESDW